MNFRIATTTLALALIVAASRSWQASAPAPGQAPTAGTGSTSGAPQSGGAPSTTSTTKSTTTTTTTTSTTIAAKARAAQGRRTGPPVPPKPPKPAWEEFKLNPKTTMFLDFTDSNADMIVSIFSRTSGITILKDPSLKVPITVTSGKSVNLDDAFEIFNAALGLNGYELQKQGKLMIVAKKQPPAPPPPRMMQPQPPPVNDKPVLKVYPLMYANATTVAKIINEVFTPQQLQELIQRAAGGGNQFPGQPQFQQPGGQPAPPKIVRASADDYTNSVVVEAPPANQADVEALIKQLDISTTAPLESRVFHLEHVAVDEVIEAIQSVLTANAPTGRGAGKGQDQNQNPFGFYYYGRQSQQKTSGAETATAIKASNSVIVSATHVNMETIKELIKTLDVPQLYVGTTNYVQLQNAKAADVATLLNNAFTKRRDQNQNDNPFFLFYDDSYSQQKKSDIVQDMNEQGQMVNVRDLTGKVNVIADPNTNGLLIVTQPSNMPLIKQMIDKLDQIADQVMIETVIVEANLDKTTKLGFEYNFVQNFGGGTSATGVQTYGLQGQTPPLQGFSYTLTGNNYTAFLNALETNTKFKVLDTPRVFTSNNVPATIDVSTQVPYITAQQTATIGGLISNYDFKNVGVVLKVTPRITSAGDVAMDVDQSADDLQGFTTFNAPIINHRQATTTVSVKNGETIILGGIIQQTTTITENKVPILGDIPLLGALFKSVSHDHNQTELMVLLTPHIIRNNAEAQKLRQEETSHLSQSSQSELSHLLPRKTGGGN